MIKNFIPTGPKYVIDVAGIDAAFPWFRNLKGSTQDPIHHAEGDVWTHTHMVCSEMVSSVEWKALPRAEQEETFIAALMHDICKPHTRKEENGRVTNKGHSKMGAIETRQILWKEGFDIAARERICAMINVHQNPFWLIEDHEWKATQFLTETSLSVPNRLLAILAEADARGRICVDPQRIIDNVEYFRMAAKDADCFDTQFKFPNDDTRVRYFLDPLNKRPEVELFDTTEFTVTFMSGLPAMGKSTFAKKQNLPIVSFDDTRLQLDDDNTGHIVQATKEKAREYLRKKQPFVWDSANLIKQFRLPLIKLALDYGARVEVVYTESSYENMMTRNRSRDNSRVPDDYIFRLMNRWEIPTLTECHSLRWNIT